MPDWEAMRRLAMFKNELTFATMVEQTLRQNAPGKPSRLMVRRKPSVGTLRASQDVSVKPPSRAE